MVKKQEVYDITSIFYEDIYSECDEHYYVWFKETDEDREIDASNVDKESLGLILTKLSEYGVTKYIAAAYAGISYAVENIIPVDEDPANGCIVSVMVHTSSKLAKGFNKMIHNGFVELFSLIFIHDKLDDILIMPRI